MRAQRKSLVHMFVLTLWTTLGILPQSEARASQHKEDPSSGASLEDICYRTITGILTNAPSWRALHIQERIGKRCSLVASTYWEPHPPARFFVTVVKDEEDGSLLTSAFRRNGDRVIRNELSDLVKPAGAFAELHIVPDLKGRPGLNLIVIQVGGAGLYYTDFAVLAWNGRSFEIPLQSKDSFFEGRVGIDKSRRPPWFFVDYSTDEGNLFSQCTLCRHLHRRQIYDLSRRDVPISDTYTRDGFWVVNEFLRRLQARRRDDALQLLIPSARRSKKTAKVIARLEPLLWKCRAVQNCSLREYGEPREEKLHMESWPGVGKVAIMPNEPENPIAFLFPFEPFEGAEGQGVFRIHFNNSSADKLIDSIEIGRKPEP